MGALVLAVLLLLVGVVVVISAGRVRRVVAPALSAGEGEHERTGEAGPSTALNLPLRGGLRLIGAGLVVLALVVAALSCVVKVGTKDVGVVTSFGRPTGRDLNAGIHLKAPWHKVTVLDAAIQPDEFDGDSCVKVRIGDGSTACASLTIQWQIAPEEASTLFQNYRSNDVNETIRKSLVVTQLKASVNSVLHDFNPLTNVGTSGAPTPNGVEISAAPDLDAYSTKVKEAMNARLAGLNNGKRQITVRSVSMSLLSLAQSTQDKINAYQAEVGNTRIAQQQQKTAAAQAAANAALADSVSKDPNVLVSRCLDILGDMVKADQAVPAGFSCWPGSTADLVLAGGGSAAK